MYTRATMAEKGAYYTTAYKAQNPVSSVGKGNVFIGGSGESEVTNKINGYVNDDSEVVAGFTCLGGEGATFVVNRADYANIQLGNTASTAISVGDGVSIFGGDKDDTIVSLGENCFVNAGAGEDRAAVSGKGSVCCGGEDDDILTGNASTLDKTSLSRKSIIDMLAAIWANTQTSTDEEEE